MLPATGPQLLHTIILDKMLVGFSEEHQLPSPVQAGFSPGQSPIHHLLALSHFNDTARIFKRPLYACFVEPQKAYDCQSVTLSSISFCGTGWSPLG